MTDSCGSFQDIAVCSLVESNPYWVLWQVIIVIAGGMVCVRAGIAIVMAFSYLIQYII